MRISDWSSDVCSSDLTGGSFVSELTRPYEVWVGQLKAREADIDEIVDLRIGLEMRTASLAAVRRTDRQIGSESSRDRVVQDVYISVVAGSLKKQKLGTNTTTPEKYNL